MKTNLIFERVVGSKQQIEILYALLKLRAHNISHTSTPSMGVHKLFVTNHPYRVWYLIKTKDKYIGSTYILKTNCIAISTTTHSEKVYSAVINYMSSRYKPLKEVKSFRPSYFYINVPPSNRKLNALLPRLGAIAIQTTFSLNSITL